MSETSIKLEESAVRQHCRALHLPTVGAQCVRLAEEAERGASGIPRLPGGALGH